MGETSESKLKLLSDELAARSNSIPEVPHFFWIHDTEAKDFAYFASMDENDACAIIEILAKRYGGEILDRVIDNMIAEDEYFKFPEFVDWQQHS